MQSDELSGNPPNSLSSLPVWPGAGIVGDRTLISEFTGKDESELGGFPVNSPDCMVQDQSVNNSWKNLAGGLYSTFQKRKPSRQTIGGFINDINSTWEQLREDSKCNRSSTKNNGSHNCSRWWSHQLYEQWVYIIGGRAYSFV